jgi:hypothetical protein
MFGLPRRLPSSSCNQVAIPARLASGWTPFRASTSGRTAGSASGGRPGRAGRLVNGGREGERASSRASADSPG